MCVLLVIVAVVTSKVSVVLVVSVIVGVSRSFMFTKLNKEHKLEQALFFHLKLKETKSQRKSIQSFSPHFSVREKEGPCLRSGVKAKILNRLSEPYALTNFPGKERTVAKNPGAIPVCFFRFVFIKLNNKYEIVPYPTLPFANTYFITQWKGAHQVQRGKVVS